jgi:hypothetical protein
MKGLDKLDMLFVVWVFFYQTILIIHFAIRKRFFESYTMRFGWVVYALGFPAALISAALLLGGKPWTLWLGGFLCLLYSAYGYYVDYVKQIAWRKPLVKRIVFPYVTLYLSTIMFYWWPLWPISQTLWIVFAGLYVISTILNIRSH